MPFHFTSAAAADVNHIVQLLSYYYKVSPELGLEFKNHALCLSLKENKHILREGELCKYMYFIKSGATAGYSSFQNKNITTYISVENDFLSSLSGLYGEKPSDESIVTLKPTVLIAVHTDVLLTWYERFFELNYIIRKIYESYYKEAQQRSYIVRAGNVRERYQYFIDTKGEKVKDLPVDMVASFLNMTPDTLHRIKKNWDKQLPDAELLKIANQIENYVMNNEVYKKPNITTATFAKEIGLTAKKINEALGFSKKVLFNDYINKHRLECFKNLVRQQQHLQDFSIDGLAISSGFSSRSRFYKVFKKHEDLNPTAYINSLKT